ncbi:MAG: GNAT family N-acetyltransferase [Oligoflexales bacterium]|nr:GNAT family N-acetyltransferase [Oligoflexales bacterium]
MQTSSKISEKKVSELRSNARQMVRELGLLKEAFGPFGVTLTERHLLLELDRSAYPQVNDIAAALLLDKSSASRLISRAVKKGFVNYVQDDHDRRRRLLQLSEKGKQALTAVETLAQAHVMNALKVLNEEEALTVCKGMELFAKGLVQSRKGELALSSLAQVQVQLRALGLSFGEYQADDHKNLCEIFRDVVETGGQFPYKDSSAAEFNLRFLDSQSTTYVCRNADMKVIAGFYLRKNPSDDPRRVANAAYMIHRSARGKGLGKLLVEMSLLLAQTQDYQAMVYNMVYSQNLAAVSLYKKFGFKITKRLSGLDGIYDGYEMTREL